jgi:signal transduction histidine kinase/DNA-binding response OmpR family regulator
MLGRKLLSINSRPPSEARTAIVAIIIVSSLAFLLFQARKDILGNLAMSEARLALQFASAKTNRDIVDKGRILDGADRTVSGDIAVTIPALPGQITVVAPLPMDRQRSASVFAELGLRQFGDDDTYGRFVIRQGRLFASVKDGRMVAMTSAPLAALLSGLWNRIAMDVVGVTILGFLLLLIRESRLSDYSIRRLLDASPVPLFLTDIEGRTEFANRGALDLFPEYPSRTLEGFRNGLRSHDELSMWLTEHDGSNDHVATREFEINSPRHPARYLLVSRQSFLVRSRQMIIASVFDVTVRHDAEAALMQAKEAAEALGRMKSESLAMISHELRTPVNGVLGLAQLLALQPLPKPTARIVNRMIQAGRTLAVIINDIVDLAMLETGHLRLDRRRFDPQETIAAAVSLASAAPNRNGIVVQFATIRPLPPNMVGDPARLQQIIINLVGNGVKFTEVGSVAVRADINPRGERDVDLTIDVVDTGIGIAPEIIPRLFQPFSQVETGHRRRFEGTGLGLAICKRLVEAMGGEIRVESEVGRGSTFRVTLPFKLSLEADKLEEPVRVTGLRVLVVDDVPLNRDVVADMLRAEHCEVHTAGSGEEAIEKLGAGTFDLVLMDIRMPGMDGLTATAAIRAGRGSNHHSVPILGLTANPLPADRPLYLLRGIDDIVEKPVERERLRVALKRYTTAGRAATEVMPPRLARLQEALGSERADRIVSMFAVVAEETTEAIADGCSRLDFAKVAEAAHRLYGAASNVGFEELSDSAARLEIVAREGRQAEISEAALRVIAAFKDAGRFVQPWKIANAATDIQQENI